MRTLSSLNVLNFWPIEGQLYIDQMSTPDPVQRYLDISISNPPHNSISIHNEKSLFIKHLRISHSTHLHRASSSIIHIHHPSSKIFAAQFYQQKSENNNFHPSTYSNNEHQQRHPHDYRPRTHSPSWRHQRPPSYRRFRWVFACSKDEVDGSNRHQLSQYGRQHWDRNVTGCWWFTTGTLSSQFT